VADDVCAVSVLSEQRCNNLLVHRVVLGDNHDIVYVQTLQLGVALSLNQKTGRKEGSAFFYQAFCLGFSRG